MTEDKNTKQKSSWRSEVVMCVIVLAVIWGLYMLDRYTDIDFRMFHFLDDRETEVESFPYLLPAIYSVGAIVLITIMAWREKGILSNGEVVTAQIASIGRLKYADSVDLTITYTWRGQMFSSKKSTPKILFKGKEEGDSIQIMVDTRNPKRFVIQSSTSQG